MLFLGETSTNRMSFRRSTKSMFVGRPRRSSRPKRPFPAPGTFAPSSSLAAPQASYPPPITEAKEQRIGRLWSSASSLPTRHFTSQLSNPSSPRNPSVMNTYEKRVGGTPAAFPAFGLPRPGRNHDPQLRMAPTCRHRRILRNRFSWNGILPRRR